ncbi:MAG: RraA family protein [Pseudomonadales bacterium]|nr:RraA family protein [Pseudomonadales bacterium]MCP5185073.1 RraA family protein [Pseudomonadales bacterium]
MDEALLARLRALDTPTICNALEIVAPERRGYGYTVEPLVCTRPGLPPMVGVARTATIRAAHPQDLRGSLARALSDSYYAYIDAGPKPSIIVIQDLDGPQRGYGSFWGEVNSNIHKGLGCLGVITDGSVRDIPDIADGFQMLADRIGPSHAYVHVVDFGRAVSVAGMRVSDGDLIHADQHGAVVIPAAAAEKIPDAAALIQKRERVIISAAKQAGFNIERLRQAQGDAAEIH